MGKGSKGPANGKSFLSQDRLAGPTDGGQDPSKTIPQRVLQGQVRVQSLGIFSHKGSMLWEPVEEALCLEGGERGGDTAKFPRPSGLTGSAGPEAELCFLNGSLDQHVS